MYRANGDAYQVECVDNYEQLLRIQSAWSQLQQAASNLAVFLSWEWIGEWWRHFGDKHALWVLAVLDQTGGLVGLAPWMRTIQPLNQMRVARVQFIGSGMVCPSRMSLLARPGYEEAVYSCCLTYLLEHHDAWDVLDLEGLTEEALDAMSPFLHHLHRVERPALTCPYIDLPGDWGTFLAAIDKKLRRNLRYFPSLLEREHPGTSSYRIVHQQSEVNAALDSLVAMHQARREDSTLGCPGFANFHRCMAARALECNWLRFYQLLVQDRPISALYCFRFQDTVYAYQIGFDVEWARYSPGRLVSAYAIEDSIREGARRFEWLQGDHAYKFEWTEQARQDHHLLAATGRRGELWLKAMHLRDQGIQALKRQIPPDTLRQLERTLARPFMSVKAD
jgi:CelD/BcsL family acetyltransferase involved in cellulose biosynthesis